MTLVVLYFVLVFATIVRNAVCDFDFFVHNLEMQRLIGIDSTLWYIENGRVNYRASEFELEILSPIDELYFTWTNRGDVPINYDTEITYEPGYVAENLKAQISIPLDGQIESTGRGQKAKSDTFVLYLPQCATMIEDPTIRIQAVFRFRWTSATDTNRTTLTIRRLKRCHSGNSPNTAQSDRSNSIDNVVPNAWNFLGSNTQFFYLFIGALFAIVFVVAAATVYYFSRIDPSKNDAAAEPPKIDSGEESPFLPPRTSSTPIKHVEKRQNGSAVSPQNKIIVDDELTNSGFLPLRESPLKSSYCAEPAPTDVGECIRQLSVDPSLLQIGDRLQEGTFGEVYVGRLKSNFGGGDQNIHWIMVIVKSVKGNAAEHQIRRFLKEALRFYGIPEHSNVCLPAAVVANTDLANFDAYSVCYSHAGFGNLKKFLMRCRNSEGISAGAGSSIVLSTQDLVHAAVQIIRGLLHLHKFCIVHRDVATRNCIIGQDLRIQLCDTGFSRDLFVQDYHCLGDNENRPVKWMPPESLERAEFGTASDVWALGVTMWELTTLALQPYATVDPYEMHAYLMSEQRLEQPFNCPDELYLLMYCCWNVHPEARPPLQHLLSALEEFHAQLTQYI